MISDIFFLNRKYNIKENITIKKGRKNNLDCNVNFYFHKTGLLKHFIIRIM